MNHDCPVLFNCGTVVPPLPPRPTREQVCAVQCELQGLYILNQYWFEPQIADYPNLADRMQVYAAKHAMGDTHINISLDMMGLAGLAWRKQLIREAITTGGFAGVVLCCMGDGHGQPNTDPGALGHDWLMAHFPDIYAYMKDGEDLTPWIVFVPGYDGVVPDWQPPSLVDEFAFLARSVINAGESGYLGLELSAGYCVWAGDEFNNWATAAGHCFDVILQEFNIDFAAPTPPPPNWDSLTDQQKAPWSQTWQMVGRMVRPYHRPADQPASEDPNPPFNLATGTPRGPYYYIAWEYLTYQWCRAHAVTAERVEAGRQYLKALGCPYVG